MTLQKLREIAKPILFSADMVQAILDGRKTRTRRIIKGLHPDFTRVKEHFHETEMLDSGEFDIIVHSLGTSRYGQTVKPQYSIGDILYGRETFATSYYDQFGMFNLSEKYLYKADDDFTHIVWKPSIHMPKEAARIFLRVTGVRAERLWDITRDDCLKEGINSPCRDIGSHCEYCNCVQHFSELWDSINAKRNGGIYSWDNNPWVWVYEFERVKVD
jgi:hypothetical protein